MLDVNVALEAESESIPVSVKRTRPIAANKSKRTKQRDRAPCVLLAAR